LAPYTGADLTDVVSGDDGRTGDDVCALSLATATGRMTAR